jgi:hypothetical protein
VRPSGRTEPQMTQSTPHVSRLVPPGPTVLAPGAAAGEVTIERTVGGDPRELGRLLAAVEPLRSDSSATVVTDADAETTRFLAVLAVLEGRAPMPDYDLADPSLKWHARKGVEAVPNPPSLVTGPSA